MTRQHLDGMRARFETLQSEYINAQSKARKQRSEANDDPTQEKLDAATVNEEAQAAVCRQFRNWCIQRQDEITRMLADPTQKFENTEPARWQKFHDDIVEELRKLEADCPITNDPPPTPPTSGLKAQRTQRP